MFYHFFNGLQELALRQRKAGELIVGIIKHTELEMVAKHFGFSLTTIEEYRAPDHIVHKLDSYYGYNFGILHIIHMQKDDIQRKKFGFYMNKDSVIIVCDDEDIANTMFDVLDKMNEKACSLEHVIATILNSVIAGHLHMLEGMENRLAAVDEEILRNKTDGFNQKTRKIRNELLFLTHYYEQLLDVCEELLQDENDFFADEEIHHLRIFADRIARLNGNVHLLKDYMLQIREACQSQVDLNLNRIMYFFTVVTTIFLPLTLIVGWYGMNFAHMPELTWEYGYLCVILLSIAIIAVCVWFIRKKKFLK